MNPQELQQKIAEYYAKLPPKAQSFFSSMKWLETLSSISERYDLNSKQIETLGTETMLVLLGIIDIDEYTNVLKKELSLQSETIDKILSEIDDKILKLIKLDLEAVFDQNTRILKEQFIQELDERFNKLPPDIKKSIENSHYQESLYAIGKAHNLNIAQMDEMEKETIMTIVGANPINDFETRLAKRIGVDNEKGLEISKEINNSIFSIIRKSMMGENSVKQVETTTNMGLPDLSEPKEEKNASVFIPKLISNYQSSTTKTKYASSNPSKDGEALLAVTQSKSADVPTSTIDPYREIPE